MLRNRQSQIALARLRANSRPAGIRRPGRQPKHGRIGMQGVLLFLLGLVVLIVGMYLGWWTLQQEEKADSQRQESGSSVERPTADGRR